LKTYQITYSLRSGYRPPTYQFISASADNDRLAVPGSLIPLPVGRSQQPLIPTDPAEFQAIGSVEEQEAEAANAKDEAKLVPVGEEQKLKDKLDPIKTYVFRPFACSFGRIVR
jgi:hypothetical protein